MVTAGDVSLFVATNGSDSTGDGSLGKPFATIHKAQAIVRKTPSIIKIETLCSLRRVQRLFPSPDARPDEKMR